MDTTSDQPVKKSAKRKSGKSAQSYAGLVFPVARVHRLLRRHSGGRVGRDAAVYMSGVLEYLTAEMLEGCGKEAEGLKRQRIDNRAIALNFSNDSDFNELCRGAMVPSGGVLPRPDQWTKLP
jgi:histone H2A